MQYEFTEVKQATRVVTAREQGNWKSAKLNDVKKIW
jgi:hypothetical protein